MPSRHTPTTDLQDSQSWPFIQTKRRNSSSSQNADCEQLDEPASASFIHFTTVRSVVSQTRKTSLGRNLLARGWVPRPARPSCLLGQDPALKKCPNTQACKSTHTLTLTHCHPQQPGSRCCLLPPTSRKHKIGATKAQGVWRPPLAATFTTDPTCTVIRLLHTQHWQCGATQRKHVRCWPL